MSTPTTTATLAPLPDAPEEPIRHGRIGVRVHARAAHVTLIRFDGDDLPLPHSEVTVTYRATTGQVTLRVPGHADTLAPLAAARRLDLTPQRAHHVRTATTRLLRAAWHQHGLPAIPALVAQQWVCIHEATGDMIAATTATLAEDLRPWCGTGQLPDLLALQRALACHRPSILTQRTLGIRLVPIDPRHPTRPAT